MPIEIDTPHGPARAHLLPAQRPRAALVLGHGAGGGIAAGDLAAAAQAAIARDLSVALVEQPYRVAGRRSPAPARHLDESWLAVVRYLAANELGGLPLIVGGRSAGARVACRTAAACGASAVICLAFPLVPRRRSQSAASRLPELEQVDVPVLIVQGRRDQFGMPPSADRRAVVKVEGDHSLRGASDTIGAAVESWLDSVLSAGAGVV